MNAEQIAKKIGGAKRTSGAWQCKCPLHDDNKPSLSISDGEKGIVFYCHAGCDQSAIFNHMKESGFVEVKKTEKERIVATYVYTDEYAKVLYLKHRYEPKSFRAQAPDGSWSTKHIEKPLYMRHTLNDLEGKTVVITEGEKDVDFIVNNYGLLATSPPNGVNSWQCKYAEVFKGANVIICPDQDEPGLKLAKTIEKDVSKSVGSVKIIDLPGKDISDSGLSKDEFLALIKPDYEAQEWIQNISSAIDYIIPFDCEARDIQQWILSTSIYPQPAIAYAAAMVCVGTLIGRNVAYEDIKGNLMFICAAESGEGKDWPAKCVDALLLELDMGNNIISKLASGAALKECLEGSPNLLFFIDEFGQYLNSINGKNANTYAREITISITELYTRAASSWRSKHSVTNPGVTITEPNLSILGLSTERQIFDGLRTSDLANGMLARYSILFGESRLMPCRVKPSLTPPRWLIEKLTALKNKYSRENIFKKCEELQVSKAYSNAKYDLTVLLKKTGNELKDSNFIPLYNRVAVRSIQQAMLIDQCQSIDVLHWCRDLELKSVELFCKKFNHLGSDNENERQFKILTRAIKEAGKNGISRRELSRKTQQINILIRDRIIASLLDDGSIFEAKKDIGKQRPTTFYYWKK